MWSVCRDAESVEFEAPKAPRIETLKASRRVGNEEGVSHSSAN